MYHKNTFKKLRSSRNFQIVSNNTRFFCKIFRKIYFIFLFFILDSYSIRLNFEKNDISFIFFIYLFIYIQRPARESGITRIYDNICKSYDTLACRAFYLL